jgi:predicted Zn-dependent peptidase
VREKRGLVYSIYSFISSTADSGFLGLYAGTSPDEVKTIMPLVREQLLDTTKNLSDEEIARAKAQVRAGIVMGLEQTSNRCENIATDLLVYGRVIGVEEWLAQIEAVNKKGLLKAAEHMLSAKPAIAAIGPEKAVAEWRGFQIN